LRIASLKTSGNSFQQEDGTLNLAITDEFSYANPDVTQWTARVEAKSIWRLDNPNLATDVANWSIESPQIFLVGFCILLLGASVITCVLCCVRGSCCFCC